jgi:hypothetical protein
VVQKIRETHPNFFQLIKLPANLISLRSLLLTLFWFKREFWSFFDNLFVFFLQLTLLATKSKLCTSCPNRLLFTKLHAINLSWAPQLLTSTPKCWQVWEAISPEHWETYAACLWPPCCEPGNSTPFVFLSIDASLLWLYIRMMPTPRWPVGRSMDSTVFRNPMDTERRLVHPVFQAQTSFALLW